MRLPGAARQPSLLLAFAALALVAGTCRPTPPDGPRSATEEPPSTPRARNVLIIVTDDQREGLEVMPKTRRWMGAGGAEFTNAFATTPLCCPSRASIMTGRYAHNHHVETNHEGQAERLDQRSTIQYHLQRAGYRTAIFGKYLNKWPLRRDPPHFDRWAILTRTPNERPDAYRGGRWNVDGAVRRVAQYSTRWISERAVSFIEDTREPWLLYVTPVAPHLPSLPEGKYAEAPVPSWDGNPAVLQHEGPGKPPFVGSASSLLEEGRRARAEQLRTLMSVDDLVQELLGTLDRLRVLDRTLVFFVSDNGYQWGEHGVVGKGQPYIPSARVPFFARWPDALPQRVRDDALVANIDIAPTVLQAVGLPRDERMDGRSLLGGGPARDRLLLEGWGRPGRPAWASTVTEGFQYIEWYRANGRVGFREYYELSADPWELQNLVGRRSPGRLDRATRRALAAQLETDRRCEGDACP